MKKRQENHHIVDLLFVLGLFLVFTISALFLVLIGSNVYKNTIDKMDQNFESRTAFAYLTEKIHQNDSYDSISIRDFDGHEALVLTQAYNDVSYSTYLYEYENSLKELFTSTDNTLTADSGQDIMSIDEFHISQVKDTLYKIKIKTPGKKSYHFYVSTRCDID